MPQGCSLQLLLFLKMILKNNKLQRTTEQPQEKCFALWWFVWVAPPVFEAGRSVFCIYFSPSTYLSNMFDRALRGGLSKLTRGASSCLSGRVVLLTRVIEVFLFICGRNRRYEPFRSSASVQTAWREVMSCALFVIFDKRIEKPTHEVFCSERAFW